MWGSLVGIMSLALVFVAWYVCSVPWLGFWDVFLVQIVWRVVEVVAPPPYLTTLDVDGCKVSSNLAASLRKVRKEAQGNVEYLFSHDMVEAGRFLTAYDIRVPSREPKRIILGTVAAPPIGNGTAGMPLVIYLHEGGLSQGSRSSEIRVMRLIAQQLPAVVVSVDYRLAPEFPFPAALHDCEDFVDHVLRPSGGLPQPFNRSRVILAGFGAGGYLVSILAQSLARRDISVLGHLVVAPMICPFHNFPSYVAHYDAPFIGGRVVSWMWTAYLCGTPPWVWDWRVSPLLAESAEFHQISPGAVLLHTFDALHDEGELYAQRLRREGKLVALVKKPYAHITISHFESEMVEVLGMFRRLLSNDTFQSAGA